MKGRGALRPERDDFWRVDALEDDASEFKEWQHVALFVEGLELLLNFSVVVDAHGRHSGRVIVLAHSDSWSGLIDSYVIDEAAFTRDGTSARFGCHRFAIRDGCYHLTVNAEERGLRVELDLEPMALPMIAHNQPIAPGRRLHWTLYARLRATGRARVGGREFDLDGALAYHDHNWGRFAWDDDFAWDWAALLPKDARQPWALVYSGLLNGRRTVSTLEQLFLWRDGVNVLAAGHDDLRVTRRGCFAERPGLRLPSVMALLHPRTDGDIPALLEVEARNGDDWVAIRFEPRTRAQLLIPSDVDPMGVVVIHECLGAAQVRGRLDGAAMEWEAHVVFELMRR